MSDREDGAKLEEVVVPEEIIESFTEEHEEIDKRAEDQEVEEVVEKHFQVLRQGEVDVGVIGVELVTELQPVELLCLIVYEIVHFLTPSLLQT